MFSKKTGLLIVSAVALSSTAFFARVSDAQNPGTPKTGKGSQSALARIEPMSGRPVGFAETKSVRQIMSEATAVDSCLMARKKSWVR